MALTKMPAVQKGTTQKKVLPAKTWHKTMPKGPITLAAALAEPQAERLFPCEPK